MKPSASLGIALACVALAIAVVAVDMQFAVRAELQAKSGDAYTTVASSQDGRSESYPKMAGCPGPELRLQVHNDQPWGSTVRVRVEASGPGPTRVLLDESWDLARGESRSMDVRVPDEVFTRQDGSPTPVNESAWVTAQVDDMWLSTCVEAA